MVKRLHTRRRRYIPVGTERNRQRRLKTFTDESKAKAYAKKLKLEKYKIVKAKFGLSKKYKIILEWLTIYI